MAQQLPVAEAASYGISPQEHTRAAGYATDHGSRFGTRSAGGVGLRRERSMQFREARLYASRAQDSKQTPVPSPTSASSMSRRQRDKDDHPDNDSYYYTPPSTDASFTTQHTYCSYPSSEPDSPALHSPVPISPPVSPRWDSLAHNAALIYDRTAPSTPTSPYASSFTTRPSIPTEDLHRRNDSLASETRDEFPPLPSDKLNGTDSTMLVEKRNFSRPRTASNKQSVVHDSPTSAWPRSRAPSVSSNKSSTFASLPVRPAPDTYARDAARNRGRQPNPLPARPPMAFSRAESSGPSYMRESLPRMASMPADELRSSYRSQLSASTAQGTVATERSSVMTKNSSITSLEGPIDDGLSVEDVMGMYEKGFEDDSAPEDNDYEEPEPATGQPAMDRRSRAVLEAMTDPLPLPNAPAIQDAPGLIIRDSAAIFRDSELQQPVLATIPDDNDGTKVNTSVEITPAEYVDERPGPTRQFTNMTTTGEDDRDRYGFRKSNQYITHEVYDQWNSGYSEYMLRRQKKWHAFLKESGLMTDNPNRFPPRSAKTKRFVRKGIPPDWRGAAWFYYAGGPAILAKHSGLYDDLLQRTAKDVDIEAIERDLHRTFPDNVRFRASSAPSPELVTSKRNSQQTVKVEEGAVPKADETPMISSLRRVLHAFSIYNPRIGYCQSLNFLAGLLLLFVESEEQAFWLLNIITRVYLPGTHELSLEGANVDLGVLMSSLRESMPAIWAKIGGELDGTDGVRPKSRRNKAKAEVTRLPPITLCMTAWFMSCFIGTLPIETTLRVWDCFFYEGSKTLFRIALTIFKLGETEIKGVGDPMEIFQVVQTIPRRLIDANAMMEACFKRRNGFGHLSQETIENRRQQRRDQVKAEKERLALGDKIADLDVKRKGTLFNRRKVRPVEAM
ncbi:TBC domain-containing protein [Xylariomycetidae sp. FL2044]|nr:TBC domain-containing protein [Xylariomycetidae sp. FL2044]